uniref:CCHC-type domain-containing protein n=1 Tax=Tanacetum cinerariifolium TaxID=118510 RepID=A0A6L2NZC2_TANCI|nr:hypothetical protein [Tanacetum cinerariifolium]
MSSIPGRDGMYIEVLERDVEVVRNTSSYEYCLPSIDWILTFREVSFPTKIVIIRVFDVFSLEALYGRRGTYTLGASGINYGKQRDVICYNCKGEEHMSKQCTKPKRKRDDAWFKDKVLLVQAQANGQIIHEEELAFLADPRIAEVALTVNLSHCGSDVLVRLSIRDSSRKTKNDSVKLEVKAKQGLFGNPKSSHV